MVSSPGAHPDLASSPDVLTCTCTEILGADGSEARRLPREELRRVAFLRVSMDDTQKRLGILARVLQWPGGCCCVSHEILLVFVCETDTVTEKEGKNLE